MHKKRGADITMCHNARHAKTYTLSLAAVLPPRLRAGLRAGNIAPGETTKTRRRHGATRDHCGQRLRRDRAQRTIAVLPRTDLRAPVDPFASHHRRPAGTRPFDADPCRHRRHSRQLRHTVAGSAGHQRGKTAVHLHPPLSAVAGKRVARARQVARRHPGHQQTTAAPAPLLPRQIISIDRHQRPAQQRGRHHGYRAPVDAPRSAEPLDDEAGRSHRGVHGSQRTNPFIATRHDRSRSRRRTRRSGPGNWSSAASASLRWTTAR